MPFHLSTLLDKHVVEKLDPLSYLDDYADQCVPSNGRKIDTSVIEQCVLTVRVPDDNVRMRQHPRDYIESVKKCVVTFAA